MTLQASQCGVGLGAGLVVRIKSTASSSGLQKNKIKITVTLIDNFEKQVHRFYSQHYCFFTVKPSGKRQPGKNVTSLCRNVYRRISKIAKLD